MADKTPDRQYLEMRAEDIAARRAILRACIKMDSRPDATPRESDLGDVMRYADGIFAREQASVEEKLRRYQH